MKNASNEHYKKFYEKLAHLFYAVAAADNEVRLEEKEVLHQMVLEDWLDLENSKDAFGTDSAFSIEVVFDQLEDSDLKSDRAFEMFEKLKEAGVKIVQAEPMKMQEGSFWFQCYDPSGNMIEFLGGE